MQQRLKRRSFWAEIGVFAIGIGAVAFAILNFTGVPITWLQNRWPAAVLLSVGVLILLVAFDRRAVLQSLGRMAATEYLETSQEVLDELERIVREAKKEVNALGARARASGYLDEIERAVTKRGLIYYRTIDRSYIYHGLHQHLSRLVDKRDQVRISWLPDEKYGNITVNDTGCVIALPGPTEESMSGLLIKGVEGSYSYSLYLRSVRETGQPITNQEPLTALCASCGLATAGNADAIRAIVAKQDSRTSKGNEGAP